MAFDSVRLPSDGAGKDLAARIAAAQGPDGRDAYLEVNVQIPENSVGYVVASEPLGAVPTVLTSVFVSDIYVERVILVNTTGGNLTIQITDGSGTELIPDITIPAKTMWALTVGAELTGGLKWKASGAGLNGAIIGFVAA